MIRNSKLVNFSMFFLPLSLSISLFGAQQPNTQDYPPLGSSVTAAIRKAGAPDIPQPRSRTETGEPTTDTSHSQTKEEKKQALIALLSKAESNESLTPEEQSKLLKLFEAKTKKGTALTPAEEETKRRLEAAKEQAKKAARAEQAVATFTLVNHGDATQTSTALPASLPTVVETSEPGAESTPTQLFGFSPQPLPDQNKPWEEKGALWGTTNHGKGIKESYLQYLKRLLSEGRITDARKKDPNFLPHLQRAIAEALQEFTTLTSRDTGSVTEIFHTQQTPHANTLETLFALMAVANGEDRPAETVSKKLESIPGDQVDQSLDLLEKQQREFDAWALMICEALQGRSNGIKATRRGLLSTHPRPTRSISADSRIALPKDEKK